MKKPRKKLLHTRHMQKTDFAQPDWPVRKNRPHNGTGKKRPVVYLRLARRRPASDAINTVSTAELQKRRNWFSDVD